MLAVLSARDVYQALPYAACAGVMREALAARARGLAYQPLRTIIRPPAAAGLMALMPCYLPGGAAAGAADGAAAPAAMPGPGDPGYGLKAICVTPGNPARGLDAHQGVVLLSDTETGRPLALLNASAVTEIRTAAVSAVATGLLARPDAAVLAIVGTGVQARAHAQAIAATRPLAQIRVAGRDPQRARRFAAAASELAGVPAVGCESVAQALDGAGIVVTATTSAAPVLRHGWLGPGTHINAVGACVPAAREIDAGTMAAAGLFADSRESATNESGDVLLAIADGAIQASDIRAELGEVITGTAAGRRDEREITVFESLGLAVEDLAAAAYAYRQAGEHGLGARVEF
jgi:ornithine cyclodeaminase/alanine dehydrogenase-like protein (mu-crystallin family)